MASGGTLPEPICLRMCLTDQHKWQKVTDHWCVCRGNGCSADVCLYIRSMYSHNMKECDMNCRTCSKVVSWLKHHVRSCNKEKCKYYERCQDVKNKLMKYKIVGCFIPKLPPTSPPSHTPSLPTPPVSTTVPHSPPPDTPPPALLTTTSNDNMDFDYDVVPQVLLRGNFPEFPEERDLYVRTLEEQLPEEEEEVASIVDQSTRLREALLQLYRDGHAYQEGHHWRRIDMIGHGGSGTAYCIEDIRSNIWLAMKEEKDTHDAVQETCISLQLSTLVDCHPPHIIEFYGASILPSPLEQNRKLQLFLELMPTCMQGVLYTCGPLPQEDAHNYCYQLFDALDFLHSRVNLVHSDLKPANLLIDGNIQRLKVADFGCARVIEDDHNGCCYRGDAKAGTLHYNPPEFYREYRAGFGMDVWQAGCCLLAMVIGRRPWRCLYADCRGPPHLKDWQRDQIRDVQIDHMVPSFLEPMLQKVLRGCLTLDYRHRLTVKDCLKLLAESSIVSTEKRKEWVQHLIGASPISTATHKGASDQKHIDVYLGSFFKPLRTPEVCLMPGWLGCVLHHSHMTYQQLYEHIKHDIQVTNTFGSFTLHVTDNSPQMIWEYSRVDDVTDLHTTITAAGVRKLPVPAPRDLVDRTKAVVISVPLPCR